jgi:hypothetical protein
MKKKIQKKLCPVAYYYPYHCEGFTFYFVVVLLLVVLVVVVVVVVVRERKVEKNFPREISFPPLNILFFPGQYFSAGQGKQNCSPGQFSFHDTKELTSASHGPLTVFLRQETNNSFRV